MGKFPVFFACLFLFFILTVDTSTIPDIIKPSQTIRDGETLVSTGRSFELGFFSPGISINRYLGIWYSKSNLTVVWVANREDPLSDISGVLNITSTGMLILYNSTNDIVWSSIPSGAAEDPVAELLESGNLVVREGSDDNPENFLWQSFDDPCDTLLPGMKLGFNLVTRLDRFLSSWKSREEDPARGKYSFHIDPNDGHPQLLLKQGNSTLFRSTLTNPNHTFGQISTDFQFNNTEVTFGYDIKASSSSRLTLTSSGVLQSFTWNDQTQKWLILNFSLMNQCERYAICGANAGCDINSSPMCACFNGFMPKYPGKWDSFDWSAGCIRRTPLNCSDKEGFMKIIVNKLPETSSYWFDKAMNVKECEGFCLKNCFCNAYANSDIMGAGNGCLIWSGDLIDTGTSTGDVQDLYVRIAASTSDVAVKKGNNSGKKKAGIIASTIVLLGMALVMSGMIFCIRRKNMRNNDNFDEVRKEDMELPIFYLSTIAHATGNFSTDNKLGEGGFGPVYKGILTEGQEIAVKRLSKSSGQGLNEFQNEVTLIAKLQHRNLVKLLGCCIHEDEKMLIYEYMPNKSLDFFIFDQTRRKSLDWSKRMNIIGGIARGLLYLHQDSRLKIIHRDIKASNILLDNELNPKISDFGLAKMFRGDQTETNTHRVVGTYGYMSPEYASDGYLSVKTDVFSFGVLVLEIVNGNKNRGFRHSEQNLNLLGHAWILWIKGTPLELIDECLAYSSKVSEVLRCIHVALLCVQQRPEDRPNMSTVVQILGNENPLPQPKQPGFFMGRNPLEQDTSSNRNEAFSANGVSLTLLEAR